MRQKRRKAAPLWRWASPMHPAPCAKQVVSLVVLPVVTAEIASPSSVLNVVGKCRRSNRCFVFCEAFRRMAEAIGASTIRSFTGGVTPNSYVNRTLRNKRLLHFQSFPGARPVTSALCVCAFLASQRSQPLLWPQLQPRGLSPSWNSMSSPHSCDSSSIAS